MLEDIANSQCYAERNLNFKSLHQPKWVFDDAGIFYGTMIHIIFDFLGFWGQAFNHISALGAGEGFQILKKWKDFFFDNADDLLYLEKKKEERKAASKGKKGGSSKPKEESKEPAEENKPRVDIPRFFVVTNNIDALVYREVGWSESEVFETRGNIFTWQCARRCNKDAWNVDHFVFEVYFIFHFFKICRLRMGLHLQ